MLHYKYCELQLSAEHAAFYAELGIVVRCSRLQRFEQLPLRTRMQP